MNLIPWKNKAQPPQPVQQLRTEMDRLFDRFFESPFSLMGESGQAPLIHAYLPPADITESEDEVVVRMDVPGLACDAIDVSVSGDTLTITGERDEEREENEKGVHLTERRYGSFRRVLQLPGRIDPAGVEARCDKGVLTVRLPRAEGSQARRVKVRHAD